MNYEGIELTEEQNTAAECMATGDDTKIQAPAGSGKTFILKAGSSLVPKKQGMYLAFNKAIATEAKATFPGHVECRTGHSLAFGTVGRKYAHRLGNIPGFKLAQEYQIGDTRLFPTRTAKGYLVLDTIRKFCYSNDPEITKFHVPFLGDKIKDIELLEFCYQDLPIQAKRIWDLMRDENEKIPVTHDAYLKIWALDKPKIHKDFLLFDEAQDGNPVLLGVMNNQTHMQRVFVGDRHQQIYGWRGAENAMEQVDVVHDTYLSQSFRFGEAIATVANDILQKYNENKNIIRIIGNPNQDSKVEQITGCPNAIICRTNGEVISNVFRYIETKKIFIQGGPQQLLSLLKGADALRNGKKTGVKDLSLFTTWDELVEYSESNDGASMKLIIKLIENYGANTLINLIKNTEKSSRSADVVITTAHKAKGLEWDHVRLGTDFIYPKKEGQILPSGEINVLYVAATRALKTLDITECTAAKVDFVLNNLEKE